MTGRRWLQLSVRCPTAGDLAALLADGLVALGARGVEERAGWYVSYCEEPDDPDAFIHHALALTAQCFDQRQQVRIRAPGCADRRHLGFL